ncbi:DUF4430 domain-containing protein [Ornithinibacillus sp. BX22]|uniref:DUF4430 domain-containing protein n=2 Tax=Ornithinibacillus TaxID=484508 RepID=A0A923RIJ2_9BACI|nr:MULTISPECIES: DUF4430 domain-containing protein [Ornithinibacillus]MBC5636758.1 DUF4430 domain-containing protein [Ornithinibacillus hominis]MBS3681325.1 DUF4430 domain-containing protein [Ornithinibacillus massiliensis]
MPNWLNRLLITFLMLTGLTLAGCDSTLQMLQTKEEASQDKVLEQEEQSQLEAPEQVEIKSADNIIPDETNGEVDDNSKVEILDKENEDTKNKQFNEDNKPTVSGGNTKVSESKSSSDEKSQQKNSTTNEHKSKSGKQSNSNRESKSNDEKEKTEDSSKSNPPPIDTIVYSIVISETEVPLPPTEMEVMDGDTVLQALIRITREKSIQMDYRGGQGATAYVEGIDNVYEFDRGSGSGWMYRVNGVFPDRGAGVVPLLPGDRVEWLYTTNLGEDLGADLKPFRR